MTLLLLSFSRSIFHSCNQYSVETRRPLSTNSVSLRYFFLFLFCQLIAIYANNFRFMMSWRECGSSRWKAKLLNTWRFRWFVWKFYYLFRESKKLNEFRFQNKLLDGNCKEIAWAEKPARFVQLFFVQRKVHGSFQATRISQFNVQLFSDFFFLFWVKFSSENWNFFFFKKIYLFIGP